uniref:Uncharacterized protein n=1 Tax=Strombidium rassoulzadegani TaxID=1082188 RepID=A0A7S3FZL9_9SPIT|mmetsp:Transcript_5562/g.9533  ORF Transcript_5562/g.9533 Transcript_5562/m.9533 type:complete len:214 (+) Transcript_5562:666-1307(+)
MFSALGLNQSELQSKVNLMLAINPIVYLTNSNIEVLNQVGHIYGTFDLLKYLLENRLQLTEVFNGAKWERILVCLCSLIDCRADFVEELYYKIPRESIGMKQILHLYQIFKYDDFLLFNYDTVEENMRKYYLPFPPSIPLEEIENVHLGLIIAKDDTFASLTDSRRLRDSISYDMYVEVEGMNHGTLNNRNNPDAFDFIKEETLSFVSQYAGE